MVSRQVSAAGLQDREDMVSKNEKNTWYLSLLSGKGYNHQEDTDLTRFTSFPIPGDPKRRVAIELMPNIIDNNVHEDRTPITSRQYSLGEVSPDLPYTREYWMPDRLCKTCYECELVFNMFRRKHHCRLCGQVFCHSCSSYSVDGRSVLLVGLVRACKMCYHQVSKVSAILGPRVVQHIPVCESNDNMKCSINTQVLSPLERNPQIMIDNHLPVCSLSIGSRFEEPGSHAAHGLLSLTTLNQMNLQQEFEVESADHMVNAQQVSNETKQPRDRSLQTVLLHQQPERIHKGTRFVESQTLLARKSLLCPSASSTDAWNAAMVDSVEASLRRRLLGSSSVVAPIAVLSATARNRETPADLMYFTRLLKSGAAEKLEKMVNELVRDSPSSVPDNLIWGPIILRLAQQACYTVNPDVRAADNMDVRPYVKIKVIPGGSCRECRYVDGIVFRKDVVHKMMRRASHIPRILLLAGGIEFQRTQSKLTSFSTLMEQEQKYTEIIVEKIVRLRPHLLFVGHSISRQAQEYLYEHDVIAIQHVKPKLMKRIARITGATILSSTDHVTSMNQYRHIALGTCTQFQIATYPSSLLEVNKSIKNSNKLVDQPHLKRVRGHGYTSYVYLTGSPKALGCTIVLRGADKAELKKIKKVVRFAVFIAYHLRLECSFFMDSGAMIPRNTLFSNFDPSTGVDGTLLSSSLAVDFGSGTTSSAVLSSSIRIMQDLPITSAFDHQSLLVTSVWMSQRTQCASAEVKGILYYTPQDVCLGQFLLDSCFNLDLKFPYGDKKSVFDITQIFYHNDGRIPITVVKMDQPIPGSLPTEQDVNHSRNLNYERRIFMWSYCKCCEQIVTPLVPMSEDTWKMSFGKFLEVCFYNKTARCRTGSCQHCIQTEHVFFYGCQSLVARFDYERIQPYGIYVRQQLPFDRKFYYKELVFQYRELQHLGFNLFLAFTEKHGELEVVLDSITMSCATKDELIATSLLAIILGELSQISSEFQSYSHWLQCQLADELDRHDKMSHKDNLGTLQFPTQFRRELYLRTTNWNQRFSLLGQLLSTAREQVKPAVSVGSDPSGHVAVGNTAGGNIVIAELMRLQNLTEPIYISSSAIDEDVDEFQEDVDLQENTLGLSDNQNAAPATLFGGNLTKSDSIQIDIPLLDKYESSLRLTDGLGTHRRSVDIAATTLPTGITPIQRLAPEGRRDRISGGVTVVPVLRRSYKISSAFARLLGKDSPEEDPWIVHLGELEGGRPRLETGDRGEVLLVHEEQPTTIIAYSLSTLDYKHTLATYINSSQQRKKNSNKTSKLSEDSSDTAKLKTISSSEHSCSENVDITNLHSWTGGLSSLMEQGSVVSSNAPSVTSRPTLDPVETISALFRRAPFLMDLNTTDSGIVKATISNNTRPDNHSLVESGSRSDDTSEPRKAITASVPISFNGQSHTDLELQMLSPHKTHIKHRFADIDEKGNTLCKFVCQAYWTTQFAAVRRAYCGESEDEELGFLRSLSMARPWNAQGGKSGATFLKTTDGRFVIKQITRTELQMFLEYAPAYFEYLSKDFFHCYATLLIKVLGVYQIGSHNRVNGKRIMEQVVVMQNLFHERLITKVFDLKGSTRSRYARVSALGEKKTVPDNISRGTLGSMCGIKSNETQPVLLDENFVEFTKGRPLPLHDQAKAYFNNAVLNDTLFLSLINVVDYSILVGMDDVNHELVVGIIDYMRQYDIIKKVERMGKSVGMIAGQAEPTVIQPPNYRNRFQAAMEKYFMMVPDKWTSFRMQT